VITTTLTRTTETERTGTLILPPPRPTIIVHARHIRHATAADTAPVHVKEGAPVVILTTDAPRCGRGVLVRAWFEDEDRYRWHGWWLLDGYEWQVGLVDGELTVSDARERMRWEAAE